MLMTFGIRSTSAVCIAFLMSSVAGAQDLSRSSVSSNSGDTPVGAQVSDQVQSFAEGVPQLQQVDRASLRDTGSRGGFVGADSADSGLFGGGTQGTRTTGTGRTTTRQTGRSTSRQTRSQPRTSRSTTTTIRPTLTLGFSYAPKPSPNLAANVASSLRRIPNLGGSPSVHVSVENGTVVLEGIVPTAHDRALSEQIVALSPGVTRIENRLAVAAAAVSQPQR